MTSPSTSVTVHRSWRNASSWIPSLIGEGKPAVMEWWDDTLIYELHVRGYTKLHPGVSESERGTYAGLANREVIDYIKSIGVTSVELLPVHTFVNDSQLL